MAEIERLSPKRTSELIKLALDFVNLLKGTPIDDVDITVTDIDSGASYASLVPSVGYSGQKVGMIISGGVTGHRYKIVVSASGVPLDDAGDPLGEEWRERYEHVLIQQVTN